MNTEIETNDDERDAIIFLPGLSSGGNEICADGAAHRLAIALDRNAKSGSAKFLVSEGHDISDMDEFQSRKLTIVREEADGTDRPVVDVYGLDYRQALREKYEGRKPILQALHIFSLLIILLPRYIWSLHHKQKSLGEKLMILLISGGLFILAVYMMIVITTTIGTSVRMVGTALYPERAAGVEENGGLELEQVLDEGFHSVLFPIQMIIVIITGLGLLSKRSIKQIITEFSIEYASVIDYLSNDAQKAKIVGQFAQLLEAITESETRYRKIQVLAFSFGSIIAIDGIFQRVEPAKRFERIDTLITVGSPFDVVRLFWPTYFDNRRSAGGKAPHWLNVYSPDDVFSSNFRNDRTLEKSSEAGVRTDSDMLKPENMIFAWTTGTRRDNFLERLFRLPTLHTAYWGGSVVAESFLGQVTRTLYADEAILA
ncbi:MAG: hypothetical protein JSU77_02160 [Fidelibacterota bacterium]|nr:MAG: hypothetical protein JSU77_02160 [Candidatus Neomarinimicrobiota bacterium]